jgi:hypothetical protein
MTVLSEREYVSAKGKPFRRSRPFPPLRLPKSGILGSALQKYLIIV